MEKLVKAQKKLIKTMPVLKIVIKTTKKDMGKMPLSRYSKKMI
jgi:hypothetical protein